MATEESLAVVLAFVEALGRGDFDAMRARLAQDATWWNLGSLPTSGLHEGRETILGSFLAPSQGRLADLRLEVAGTTAQNDRVAVEMVVRGRIVGGGDYANHYHTVFEVAGGRVVSVRNYFDTLAAKEALFS